MAKYQYAAGVIQNINRLTKALAIMPDEMGRELLRSCLTESPKPPWDTGLLRNSGAVYRGTSKVATTESLGLSVGENPMGVIKTRGSLSAKAGGEVSILDNFKSDSRGEFEIVDGELKNFRSTLTVVFHAPHAALMHDHSYKARAPDSGPGYIYEKLASFGPEFALIAKRAMRI